MKLPDKQERRIRRLIGQLGVPRNADRAIDELVEIGERAVPHLFAAYYHSSSGHPKTTNAITAMIRIGGDEIIDQFTRVLFDHDRDEWARYRAVEALSHFGRRATPHLIRTLRHDPSDWVRGWSAEVLGMIGSSEAVPALIEQVKNAAGDTREYSVRALYELPDIRAVGALASALTDRNWETAMWAASALGRTRSEDAIPHLLKALKDERDAVRSAAALALAEIGRPDTVAEVARLLDDDEKSIAITAPVNTFAVKALEKFGTPEALQALAEWKAREERRA